MKDIQIYDDKIRGIYELLRTGDISKEHNEGIHGAFFANSECETIKDLLKEDESSHYLNITNVSVVGYADSFKESGKATPANENDERNVCGLFVDLEDKDGYPKSFQIGCVSNESILYVFEEAETFEEAKNMIEENIKDFLDGYEVEINGELIEPIRANEVSVESEQAIKLVDEYCNNFEFNNRINYTGDVEISSEACEL